MNVCLFYRRTNPKPRKISRRRLMEELIALKTELAIVRSEKEQLVRDKDVSGTATDQASQSERSTVNEHPKSESESLLVTMNHMSLGSLNIPECKPSDGEIEVDKKAYEHWKEIILASFNLVHASDEHARMDIFRIKAGAKLLEVMQGTASTVDMPQERTHPFSNAIARLDRYFGSRTYIIGQRGKLMNTVQLKGEPNTSFVRRVATAAKLCDYKGDEEMEAIVRTLVKGASDSRVRVLAHRNWVNQGDMNSLIALVRDREMEVSNEEEYQKLNRQSTAAVAVVSQTTDQQSRFRRGTAARFRGNQRGRVAYQRGQPAYQGSSKSSCWRCASMYHGPGECPNLDKVCHNCNRRGHLARTCSAAARQGFGQKRLHSGPEEEEPRPKLAAITQNGEDNEERMQDVVKVE